MGTNFYWKLTTPLKVTVRNDDPDIHIGKRYAAGGGKLGFHWAQDPTCVRSALARMALRGGDPVVIDEYDHEYDTDQFLAILAEIYIEDIDSVGTEFS